MLLSTLKTENRYRDGPHWECVWGNREKDIVTKLAKLLCLGKILISSKIQIVDLCSTQKCFSGCIVLSFINLSPLNFCFWISEIWVFCCFICGCQCKPFFCNFTSCFFFNVVPISKVLMLLYQRQQYYW